MNDLMLNAARIEAAIGVLNTAMSRLKVADSNQDHLSIHERGIVKKLADELVGSAVSLLLKNCPVDLSMREVESGGNTF